MPCYMMSKQVKHIHLYHVPDQKATFDIHNSPLSEAAVVGFEYGYNVENKKASIFGKRNMVILQICHK